MEKKISISRVFLLSMLGVTIVSISLLGCLWMWQQYVAFHQESENLQEMMLASYRNLLRTQVEKTVDYIEYSKSLTEKRLRASIQDRTHEAHTMASHLYAQWQERKPSDEIMAAIRESLRSMRFNRSRGYYFILDTNGINRLQADRPESEGRNMLEITDGHQAGVVRDIIRLATLKEEGFYRYDWSKPGIPDGTFPKIAFVKLFAPYNWIIGTGEYLNDFEAAIKEDVLNYLGTIRFGKDGYVFVTQWDGLDLTGPAKGKNMLGVTDVNGLRIVQELIALAKSGGGFLRYVMPKFKGMKPVPKLSYVQGIKDWQWYVGAGMYIDDIEDAIGVKQAEMTREIIKSLAQIMTILMVLILFACFVARRTSLNAKSSFSLFTRFFSKGAREDAVIDPGSMKYEEFETLARAANDMIKARVRAQAALSESERQYRLIVENLNDLIIKLDRNKNLIFASPTYCGLFGKTAEELLNQAFLPQVLEEDRQVAKAALDQLDMPPFTSYHEERAMTQYGMRWLAWSSRAIQGIDGLPAEYVAIGRDITEKKQAEYTLRENQEWLQSILDSIQAGVIVIDPETHIIIELNRAAAEMIGTEKSRILNSICHNHICPNDIGMCPVTDLGLAIEQSDRELLTVHGTRIPIMKTVNTATINGKEYLIESFLDLTDKKHLESMLLQAQKMESIGTLAGGIAHDFNNILSAIIGYTELSLMSLPPDDSASDYLAKVLKAGDRARSLVHQILTFSRQADHELKPVSVKLITQETLRLLSASLPSSIEIQEQITTDGMVMGDPAQIHQILMNLCTNAGHAMQKTGGTLEVSLNEIMLDAMFTSRYPHIKPGPYINLTVRDSGHGIPPEVLDRIFDPFFTTKQKGEGTGLGLAVVHGIAKACGGMIRATSEPCAGSIFEVILPAIDRYPEIVEEQEENLPCGTEQILFVDDEPALIEIGKQLLESLGYQVITRTDPQKALELFIDNPERFDLVITDMTMPRMTGETLTRQLLSIREDIPVMLCTGFSSEMTETKANEMGIKGFLIKPIVKAEMARIVRQLLDTA